MIPPPIDPLPLQFYSLWQWYHRQPQDDQFVYIRARRTCFKRPIQWEPWNDHRIPPIRFVEYFRMSLEDFRWLSDELRPRLQQDPLGRGEPLSVEAQVAVGLYRLGHGASFVNISHVFNIGKDVCALTEWYRCMNQSYCLIHASSACNDL
ncbi:hypothetical protein PGTUg99_033829 [Puccinia graminis f. sp. tritici]|uniref:Uncharacterized protein n=1 Tax=Puccinia graminis f. sp. tritici TaxID=56615 RepID=A0A5B0MHW2_PUCGR|nr:hypothetical protein PGTUg99_033829 [Puccinia graminis f. sp. tritici]